MVQLLPYRRVSYMRGHRILSWYSCCHMTFWLYVCHSMVWFLYLYNYDCVFLVGELAIRPSFGHLYITTYDFGYVSITTMINRTYCEAVICI